MMRNEKQDNDTRTAAEVARWMKAELDREILLYQDTTADEIQRRFGEQFTYINDNGNLAIARPVLAQFRKLTQTDVVWERGERCWRKRQQYDPKTGRSVE